MTPDSTHAIMYASTTLSDLGLLSFVAAILVGQWYYSGSLTPRDIQDGLIKRGFPVSNYVISHLSCVVYE